MDFVLALHSHMPWVLHHGRWPHGSDWLSEAAVDTYLPLLDTLLALEKSGVAAPVTLGITPVLASQLSHPHFISELQDYFEHRLEACDEAPATLAATGDAALLPIAKFWRDRFQHLLDVWKAADCDMVSAFRGLEQRGRLEILSSCATHGFLPLLGRDESIRLQLQAGKDAHKRLFGREPTGLWLPECAYRPVGRWAPEGAKPVEKRLGTDAFLAEAGYRYFFVDSHLPNAGPFLDYDGQQAFGTKRAAVAGTEAHISATGKRSPYLAYRLAGMPGKSSIAALVRDPESTLRVWSRGEGYPGDGAYLEFHKIRWPEGLKLWRVTGGGVDLGGKLPYDPRAARDRARIHADHFAGVLADTATRHTEGDVIAAPFDTELFGHWWSEGVDFLGDVFRDLRLPVTAATARDHIARHPPTHTAALREGSWGAHGDFSMWMGPSTSWTWQRMWKLEDQYWAAAPRALRAGPAARRVLEQATRALLLAQASDWQFIISTGNAGDYAEKRFRGHCEDAEQLLAGLGADAVPGGLEAAAARADELGRSDDLFPGVLESVERVLG